MVLLEFTVELKPMAVLLVKSVKPVPQFAL